MSKTIAGSYSAGITLTSVSDDPTTVTSTGLLQDGLKVLYSGAWQVLNQGTIQGPSAYGVYLLGGGTVTNETSGTITGHGGISGGGGLTVSNAGSIGGGSYGVLLKGGGYVTNQSGGIISGYEGVTGDNAAAVTLVNAGTITAQTLAGIGVLLTAAGTVINQSGGTITGAGGIYGESVALTVINGGSISGYNIYGVALFAGGHLTNQSGGAITGLHAAVYADAAMTVANDGAIVGSEEGIYLKGGGSITNQSGGTITGGSGIYGESVALTVINGGIISGYNIYGVALFAGGHLTNQSGGAITGQNAAVYADAAMTVVNDGAIVSAKEGICVKGGGSITNQSGGMISGGSGAILSSYTAVAVSNYGTITGGSGGRGEGIVLIGGGSVTNQANGTISAAEQAIASRYIAIAVTNYGMIAANYLGGQGIVFIAGGSVSNQSGGTISGNSQAIGGLDAAITVVNAGLITAANGNGGAAIYFDAGGSVTNQTGGTISSAYKAIFASYAAIAVVNAGLIAAHGSHGAIELTDGGSVTNQAGGTINGFVGVYSVFAGMTVLNAGTITGTGGTAAQFVAGQTNLLTIDPCAVFSGTVDGGNTIGATAASTIELAPGASGGTLSGLGTQFVDFAQVTVDAGASWTLIGENTLAAGTTLTNAGTLTIGDTTLSDAGLVVNNGDIQIDPSSLTLADLIGTGDITIDNGSTLDVLGTVTPGETIVFAGTNDLLGANPTGFASQVNGFTLGDTIDLAGVTDGLSAQIVNGNTLEILRSGNSPVDLTLDPTVDYTGGVYAISATGAVTVTEVAPCFVSGTLIRTARGELPVELLAVGDRVMTLSGSARPIRWIGRRNLDLTRHPAPRHVQPIAIRAHAFGDGAPNRDLFLSPEHAVLMDGGLVPVRLLVNGASIQRIGDRRRVTYYHVELETHDIVLAENLAVESYLETGNRGMFENAIEPLRLYPDPTNDQTRRTTESCAPFVDDPARVQPMWQTLTERAVQLGWTLPAASQTTDDPALCLIVDGRQVAPVCLDRGKHVFVVPPGTVAVRLRSRVATPSDAAPWVSDDRRLGVLLSGLTVRSGADAMRIPLDDPGFGPGWWQAEWHGSAILRRWTDGNALVPMPDRMEGICLLEVEVAATLPYPLHLAVFNPPPIRRSA
jgi:Hint domain